MTTILAPPMVISDEKEQYANTAISEEKRGSISGRSSIAESNPKPWLKIKRRQRADRAVKWTFISISLVLGFGSISAVIISAILSLPPKHKYCIVLDEQFNGDTLNTDIWSHEQQTGGWGTGEFEWTTDSANNSFVRDGSLYILPTLTSDSVGEAAIIDGYTLNLTETGHCTSSNKSDLYCASKSNASTRTILPPIQSARITTKISNKVIKFGKVEVTAQMPTGDWIWPAVWMMPSKDVYGPWPASGEIDIFESKGNPSRSRKDSLSASMLSTLHWGPLPAFDQYKQSHKSYNLFESTFSKSYQTFGLEWDDKQIRTWRKTRAYGVLTYKFGTQTMWEKGAFPQSLDNGTVLTNPWTFANGANILNVAPFDQDFYLILSVAVGSTNGYFQDVDGVQGKPWSDTSDTPARDFWTARDKWLPSWPKDPAERAMKVDSVKMWQQCD